jgi:hypothetical protein
MQLDPFQCAYFQMVMEMSSPIPAFPTKLLVTIIALSLDFTGNFHFLEIIPDNRSQLPLCAKILVLSLIIIIIN